METNSKDFAGSPGGAVKNAITGKTIREMTWDELFSLARASKPMTQALAMKQMKAAREAKNNGQSL